MKTLLNLKNDVNGAVLRLGIFAVLAALIVLIFPRYNNTFRYHFEIGKPWGYSLLTAEFDFPIYKTDDQVEEEQKKLLSTFTPYYKYVPRTQRDILVVSLQDHEWLRQEGYGSIAIMQNRVKKTHSLSGIYTPASAYKRFGYEVAQNLVLDTALTEKMRTEELKSLSPTQGLVQAGEKIIDKGDIVTEHTYQILQSLRRANEDEKIGNHQRALSIMGEAMLVLLFLSLFVIYLYVFRLSYARDTRTILFFCMHKGILSGGSEG